MRGTLIFFVLLYFLQVSAYQSYFIQGCLKAHNQYRQKHGVPALQWSAALAESAQKWANHLAAIDQMQHDASSNLGENIFYMYGGNPHEACERAVRNWYEEGRNYDFKAAEVNPSTSHFSQTVWNSTKEVGVGTAESKSKNFFLVARYSPKGNVAGKYNDNVSPPLPGEQDTALQPSTDSSPVPQAVPQQPIANNTSPLKISLQPSETSAHRQQASQQNMRTSFSLLKTVPQQSIGSYPQLVDKGTPNYSVEPQSPYRFNMHFHDNGTSGKGATAKLTNPFSSALLQQSDPMLARAKLLTTQPPPAPPVKGKDYRVEIKFTDMTFTEAMNRLGSEDFMLVRNNITYVILDMYEDYDDFQEVQLMSLRSGSVIALLGLIFNKKGQGHLDLLTNALKSGKLGGFAVDTNYISAIAVPDGYLKLTRPQQPPLGNECPQPCSRPTHCYANGCTVPCCSFNAPAPGSVHSPATPTCPSSCDVSCHPQCPIECCAASGPSFAPTPPSYVDTLPPPASTSSCPAACPFSCYPDCTPQCCSTPTTPIQCPSYCPASCRSHCTAQCCSSGLAKKSNRLSYLRALYLKQRMLLAHSKPGYQGRRSSGNIFPYMGISLHKRSGRPMLHKKSSHRHK